MPLSYIGNQPKVTTGVSLTPTPPSNAQPGDLWWDTEDGTMKVFYTDDDNTSQWVEINTGSAGPAGQNGVNGAAATVTVGTTTTLIAGQNASVTNSGTTSAAVLNFNIPRGNRGVDGRVGPKTVGLAYPSTADTQIVMFCTDYEVVANGVTAILPGATTGSAVSFTIKYGTSLTGGQDLITFASPQPLQATTTPDIRNLQTGVTLPANTLVWIQVTSVVGTVPMMSVTINFT